MGFSLSHATARLYRAVVSFFLWFYFKKRKNLLSVFMVCVAQEKDSELRSKI